MFDRSVALYDVLYGFKDYAGAAARLRELVARERPGAASLLDVGCGTGRHLEHLRDGFDELAGLDLSEAMLAVARQRNPGVELHQGDMADFDLGRRFDVVTCLFSSIGYVRTLARMRSAIAAMARHLAPGGLLVVEPWFAPERFWTHTITANFVDRPELKVAWMYTSETAEAGRLSVLDIHYLVGRPEGVEHFRERHEMGLFADAEYLDAFRDAGIAATHDPEGLFRRGLFHGRDRRPFVPAARRDGRAEVA